MIGANPGSGSAPCIAQRGLEFEAVAIIDVNEGIVPPKRLLEMAPDPVLRRSVVEFDKSLLHVSATRAKKRLFVSASGAPRGVISPGRFWA